MDDGGPTASIILFIALILTDMFFYGFGSAINNLNMKEIEKKAKEENGRYGIFRDGAVYRAARFSGWGRAVASFLCGMPGAQGWNAGKGWLSGRMQKVSFAVFGNNSSYVWPDGSGCWLIRQHAKKYLE